MPKRSKTKMSCIEITSPSMPVSSVIDVTLRVPSAMRLMCTTRLTAEATCWRIARSGMFRLAMATIVSRRYSASRALLAWTVVRLPSWPVFIACSMSSASSPRTSPTMMRSGRIRRALITSCRCLTAPLPSMLGGRVSRRTTWRCRRTSSAASSTVTMRSLSEMNPDSTLSSVVFPAPVPPETMTLVRQATAAWMKSSIGCVSESRSTMSWAPSRSVRNRRIDSAGPSSARGGMMAFTREPSASLASTIGLDSSMRRPTELTMRSMIRIRCWSSLNTTSTGSRMPWRSTYTWSNRFTRMSDTSGSASSSSSGPRPNSSLRTSPMSDCRS